MATFPTLDGFTPGEKVTAAKLTEHTKTAIEALYYKPVCHMYAASVQSFSNSSTIKHALNTVIIDTDGMADVANNQMVIVTPGLYRVTFGNAWESNATGVRAVFLYRNGSSIVSAQAVGSGSGFIRTNASFILRCSSDDTLEIRGNQNSGGNLNTRTDYGGCFLQAEWIAL